MLPVLSEIFGRFVGRDVAVIEQKRSVDIGDRTLTTVEVTPLKGDAVLKELKEEADRHGLKVRLWTPGPASAGGSMERLPDCVNVYLDKAADGKYRIGAEMNFDGEEPQRETFDAIVARGVAAAVPVMKPLRLNPPPGSTKI